MLIYLLIVLKKYLVRGAKGGTNDPPAFFTDIKSADRSHG